VKSSTALSCFVAVWPRRVAACPRSRPGCRCRPAPVFRGADSCWPPLGLPCLGRVLDLPHFEEGVAKAAAASPNQRVLVSVYLQGGIDSMSVLYPTGEPLCEKYRPVLALLGSAGPAFAEDPRLHWHPLAAPFAQLHGEGSHAAVKLRM